MNQFRVLLAIALTLTTGSIFGAAQDFIGDKHIFQGDVSVVAYDSSGAKYIVSEFHTTVDFNPNPGVNDDHSGPRTGTVTKINADGTYAWTHDTGVGVLRGIIVSGSTVYVAGHFSGTNTLVGGTGPVSSGTFEDIFVLALKASDGSPETAFSGDGVAILDSGGQDFAGANGIKCNCMAISGTSLFVVGTSSSAGPFVASFSTVNGSTLAPFGPHTYGPTLGTNDDVRAIAAGPSGTLYITGKHQVSGSDYDAYILAIDGSSGNVIPGFGVAGLVRFGGANQDAGESIIVSNGTVYVGGEFQGGAVTGAGFNGANTINGTNLLEDGFVIAVDASTGSPVSSFNGAAPGIVTFTGAGAESVRTIVLGGNTLYVSGATPSNNFGINGAGTVSTVGATTDAFVAAIDTATGKAVTSFSGDGIYTFGALGTDVGRGLAIAPAGNVITLSGSSNGTDIGGPINLGSFPDGIGFAVDINIATGSVDWVVSTTSASGPGSLPVACALARYGSKISFDPNTFDLRNSDAATVISLSSGLTLFDDNITIDGSDRRVTLNGSAATSQSGFTIKTSNCRISGLSIVAFPRHGIQLQAGAKNNILGGNRGSGMGPNGQGLRLSSNGIAGIDVTGSTTSGNTIKGCWIGLDASGLEPKPNLAGILIENGANGNIIGGATAGDENVISGNEFEGVTVSGAGSDANTVIGNRVGIAGVQRPVGSRDVSSREETDGGLSRSALGNGSAGVFLSLGTNASKVGGTGTGEGNTIANNGNNGVEVRALQSRRNSARANRITRNVRGGIGLFDGANDGIAAPKITSVKRNSTSTSASTSRSLGRTTVSGTSADGDVEIYNDTGSQGATLLTKTTASGGTFSVDVDSDDTQNITATLTDASGNTSSFTVFAALNGADTDGDGVSDTLEALAGTDSNSSSSTPTKQGSVLISKGSVTAKFNATGKDSISCTLNLALPDGFSLPNAKVGVYFAGVSTIVTLDEKGKAQKGTASLKIKESTTTTFTFSVKNQDLRSALEAAGFTNTTTDKAGTSVLVNIGVGLNDGTKAYVYDGTATMTYKATADKQGKASLSK